MMEANDHRLLKNKGYSTVVFKKNDTKLQLWANIEKKLSRKLIKVEKKSQKR